MYEIILKSGASLVVKPKNNTRSVIGLWAWSQKQAYPQILNFNGVDVLSTEIAAIIDLKEYPLEITEVDDYDELL